MASAEPGGTLAHPGFGELPEGWMVQDLGELAAIRSGDFLKRERYSREAVNPVPVAGAGGPIGWTEQANCQPPVLALGRVGAAGVVRSYDTPVWATDNVLVVEPRDERYHAWIRFFLQTVNWPELRTGSTQPLITQTVVRRILIPVPPVEEQRRIVAKVEALLARVNAARDRLARVPAILKRFRQSILAAACSGRLTGDWREQEGRGDTAGTLLEAILADRRRRFGGMLQEARTAGGRQPGAPKNLERSEVEAGDLPALPDSWAWAVWDDLVDWITYGFTRPMPHVPDGVPIVTAKSIRDSRIDLDSLDHTTTEAFEALSEKDRPQVGEILLTKDGSIGRAAIVQTSEPFCINQSVAVLRFGGLTAFVPYLLHLIHSDLTQRRIEAAAKGTAIPHISITAFGRLPVPLPPVREQQEIVDRVEALFALADTIEQRATAALRRTDRLAQSILSKAFRGELMQTANGSVGPPK